MTKPFILVITGPAGSGKTTVAAKLATEVEHCVNIEVDHVKHFIVNGFIYDRTSQEGIEQWQLLGTNLGMLARNFAQAGYNVIVNGYLNQEGFEKLQDHVLFTHKILLLPQLEVAIQRDSTRPKHKLLGDKTIREHHDYFSDTSFFDDFTRLDSTSHTSDETVKEIMRLIGGSVS